MNAMPEGVYAWGDPRGTSQGISKPNILRVNVRAKSEEEAIPKVFQKIATEISPESSLNVTSIRLIGKVRYRENSIDPAIRNLFSFTYDVEPRK